MKEAKHLLGGLCYAAYHASLLLLYFMPLKIAKVDHRIKAADWCLNNAFTTLWILFNFVSMKHTN